MKEFQRCTCQLPIISAGVPEERERGLRQDVIEKFYHAICLLVVELYSVHGLWREGGFDGSGFASVVYMIGNFSRFLRKV